MLWIIGLFFTNLVLAQPQSLSTTLKASVVDAKAKLGQLDEVQSKIYDAEVIPQYQRFVKDYKQTTSGVSAEVDIDGLKKYLAFRSFPTKKKLIISLKVDKTCEACNKEAEAVRKILIERVQRRGFQPLVVSYEEINDPKHEGKALLVFQLQPGPAEDIDSAHADEKHYQIKALLMAESVKYEGLLDLHLGESFDSATVRLLMDVFIDLGSQTLGKNITAMSAQELLIEISGIQDFAHFSKIKSKLQVIIGNSILERKLSRGMVVFALQGNKTAVELEPVLSGTNFEPGRLSIKSVEKDIIKAEIR